jgi:hypothetical protein
VIEPIRYRAARLVDRLGVPAATRVTGRHYIGLEYPPNTSNTPRWGHGCPTNAHIKGLLEAHDGVYLDELAKLAAFTDALREVPPVGPTVYWENPWFTGLDAIAMYGVVRSRAPKMLVEIGSGMSTHFAAMARGDARLNTELIVIDPQPRRDVAAIVDRHVASALEAAPLAMFSDIQAGDVVFFDGSHCTFMNNDVTVFFLEILPGLPGGVTVGVHDVFLPDDYPASYASSFPSEQYLVAALLLGGDRYKPLLPCWYLENHTTMLAAHPNSILTDPAPIAAAAPGASSFWFTT